MDMPYGTDSRPTQAPVACLDTSAINNLLDDPERDELCARILRRYEVAISSINILEIAKTRTEARREALRHLAKMLGRDLSPLELPNHLIRQVCRLVAMRQTRITWSVADERAGFWVAMAGDEAFTANDCEEATAYLNSFAQNVNVFHASLRKELDESVFSPGLDPRPYKATQVLRAYINGRAGTRRELPRAVFALEIGREPTNAEIDAMLSAKPSIWALFLLAHAFAVYYGAVWENSHGRRNRVGIVDLLYAVYLPICDVFVTHDMRNGGQFGAFRILNAFNARRPRTRVLSWAQFKRGILEG
jgi:hypothetical protein